MNELRDLIELCIIPLRDDEDIAKSEKISPRLKQLSPSNFTAFVGYIKKFREERGINPKEFLRVAKDVKRINDKCIKEHTKNSSQRSPNVFPTAERSPDVFPNAAPVEKQFNKKYIYLFNWIKSKFNQQDIVNIRDKFKYSSFWDSSIKKYILTGIMPNPYSYKLKFDLIKNTIGSRKDWTLDIEVYGDTTCEDIIKPSSWEYVEQYKRMVFGSKKRSVHKTPIQPIFNNTTKTLTISIYPDTTQAEIKSVWPEVIKYQANLIAIVSKYTKPIKHFDENIQMSKCFNKYKNVLRKNIKGVERLETYEIMKKFSNKIYKRIAKRRERIIKKGYVKSFLLKRGRKKFHEDIKSKKIAKKRDKKYRDLGYQEEYSLPILNKEYM